jgi:hypothetical protein
MIDQDHRVDQRRLELIVIEVVDGFEVVARPPSIKVRSISGEYRIFPLESLFFSFFVGKLESLDFDFFPILNWLPALLSFL